MSRRGFQIRLGNQIAMDLAEIPHPRLRRPQGALSCQQILRQGGMGALV